MLPGMPRVIVENDNGIGWLTLNDPDRRNILSAGLVDELVAAIDAAEADRSVHALVITGAGPAFCAGADLGDLLAAGLALRAVPAAELLEQARQLASAAASTDRELIVSTKHTLRMVVAESDLTHDEALNRETRAQFWSLGLPSTAGLLRELRGKL